MIALTSISPDICPVQTAATSLLLVRKDADIAPVRVGLLGVETLQDPIGVLRQLGNLRVKIVQIGLDNLHLFFVVILNLVGLADGETAKGEDDGEEEFHLSTTTSCSGGLLKIVNRPGDSHP